MPSPELIAALYPTVRSLHITLVTLSVALFTVRGLGVLAGQAWPMTGWARGLAPVIDSLLLLAGGTLWWLLQLNPTQNHWLLAKLVLLIVYIVLGTLASAAVYRFKFFGRETISLLLLLPIALPGIVTGIALRSSFGVFDIPFSFWTIVIGHATFCVVTVYNNAIARFRRMNKSVTEASMDLGANGFQTFRYVVLPELATALLAGAMLAFALSFDEVIVTTFTAGQQQTLPIWMFAQLVRPRQRPVTNVAAFIVIAITTIPIYLAYRWTSRTSEQ